MKFCLLLFVLLYRNGHNLNFASSLFCLSLQEFCIYVHTEHFLGPTCPCSITTLVVAEP